MAEFEIHRGELSTDPIVLTMGGRTHHLDGGWTYLGHPVWFVDGTPSSREADRGRGRRSRFDRRSRRSADPSQT